MKAILLSVLLLIGPFVVGGFSCTCAERDDETLFGSADTVFMAKVTNTRLVKYADMAESKVPSLNMKSGTFGPEAADIVEAEFTVTEVFKKGSGQVELVRDLPFGFGNCSIGLMSGMTYIFFIQNQNDGIKNYVGMCTGSRPINIGWNGLNEFLGKLRSYGTTGKE
jgi:hypothetical protein